MRLLFAYIDPGAGSLVIQAIIAGLVSIPFFFRNAIRSTFGRFRRKSSGETSPSTATTASEEKGVTGTEPE